MFGESQPYQVAEIPMIFPVILGNQSKMELLYQEKELSGNERLSWCRVSTRGECRWPRADAAVHLHNRDRACAPVTCLHAPRVSQLLLPSCSFPDMRPATNSFSWYKSSIFDWFPSITGYFISIPAKRLGIREHLLVPGKDAARAGCTTLRSWRRCQWARRWRLLAVGSVP